MRLLCRTFVVASSRDADHPADDRQTRDDVLQNFNEFSSRSIHAAAGSRSGLNATSLPLSLSSRTHRPTRERPRGDSRTQPGRLFVTRHARIAHFHRIILVCPCSLAGQAGLAGQAAWAGGADGAGATTTTMSRRDAARLRPGPRYVLRALRLRL